VWVRNLLLRAALPLKGTGEGPAVVVLVVPTRRDETRRDETRRGDNAGTVRLALADG
jgi:hypothetical protein